MRAYLNDHVGIEFDPTSTAVGTADGILTIKADNSITEQDVPVKLFSNNDQPIELLDEDKRRLLGIAKQTLIDNGIHWANPIRLKV